MFVIFNVFKYLISCEMERKLPLFVDAMVNMVNKQFKVGILLETKCFVR